MFDDVKWTTPPRLNCTVPILSDPRIAIDLHNRSGAPALRDGEAAEESSVANWRALFASDPTVRALFPGGEIAFLNLMRCALSPQHRARHDR